MKKLMLILCLAGLTAIAFAATNDAVVVLPTAELVPNEQIPTAITALLGRFAPFWVSLSSTLFTIGLALKPFMASFQHGMNDRLAFSVDILGTDADLRNRKLLSSAWYRTIAYWADLLIRLKLPTIEGYMAQLKAQSTPGVDPVPPQKPAVAPTQPVVDAPKPTV